VDIKDFILIGGGLLIAAVIAHGFWIAWRDRRQDYRIDIKPDLIPEEMSEIDRLRGELPNGGGRVVSSEFEEAQQDLLDLEEPPPLLLEPTEPPPSLQGKIEPGLEEPVSEEAALTANGDEPIIETIDDSDYDVAGVAPPDRTDRPTVAEVSLPEPIVADEPRRPRRLGQRKTEARSETPEPATSPVPVEELIVMTVLSEPASPYTGDELVVALQSCGLKFGDMNIYHRIEPLTKILQYSVASAVEPGTFDMADMEAIRCPGLCLFMQLPGPEDPTAAFEDMLSVARSVAKSLGGEVKDEHRNVMTPQTVEHYRQRIVDFSRRRMSKRA
jgi:cell division protein ZipA